MNMTKTISSIEYKILRTVLLGTTLVETAQADPVNKSSPKIAHGMYRDVLRYEIELAFERLDFGLAFELAFELLDELDPRLGRPPVRH
ncbi:MAG: hypothetical protein OSA98_14810 [Rubripirellula sp.]|nr:hypothetical protein [Rubripirellula sp.]